MKLYQHLAMAATLATALSCAPRYFITQSDVNRDGIVDLVVGEESGDLYVLLNCRAQREDTQQHRIKAYLNGRLEELPVKTEGYVHDTISTLRDGIKELGVFDLNNDGLEDVIAVDQKDQVYVFYNEGQGNFSMVKRELIK